MSGRVFVDTNILVYAIENRGPKGEIARGILREDDVCLSTQVLGEFYVVVTRSNRTSALTHEEAVTWIQLWKKYEVRDVTLAHVDLALELKAKYGLSYFDSQIVAAASLADCQTLISEDMSSGQSYGDVSVQNPFEAASR
jgi:predicted nucleic acid-binding protein